jgi:hypothetical protein
MPPARRKDEIEHARAALERGELAQAEAICRRIVAKDKSDPNAWQILGLVANRRGWFDKAAPCFEQIVRLLPNDPMAHCQLASARMHQGRFDDARAGFDRALALNGSFAPALRGKAELLERAGDAAAAHALLAPLATRPSGPPDAETSLVFAQLTTRLGRPAETIPIVEGALARANVQPITRRKLLFALGRAFERVGRHDDAFTAWAKANATASRPYARAEAETRTNRLIELFSPPRIETLPRAGGSSDVPVFVVGMPRSGSTLIEQIIDAHPQAFGAGELTAFTDLVASMPQTIGSAKRYPDWIEDIPAKAIDRLARPYVAHVTTLAPGAVRVADKNLLNHIHVGLISLLLPQARVIHCRRDPVETGFSCFANDLSPVGFPWSGDLADIAHYASCCDRLMRQWLASLDLAQLVVQYEELVDDQERVSRRIIEFCGLPWDDRCLRFHETGRAVTTLSYDQVRRPIYRSALKASAPYAKHLAALRA